MQFSDFPENVFNISVTEYYKLPKLYKYDDFDRCLQEFDAKAVYCIIDTHIKPNTSAAIWPLIEVS